MSTFIICTVLFGILGGMIAFLLTAFNISGKVIRYVFLSFLVFGALAGVFAEIDKNNTGKEDSTKSNVFEGKTCNYCGNKFSHNGYKEVSNGVWTKLSDPYESWICSKSCGMKHTNKMNGIMNDIRNN